MNKRCCFIFFALFYLFVPVRLPAIGVEPHHTTAYIGPARELQALLTFSTYFTERFWNKKGECLETYNRFNRQSYLLYAEYSLNRRNSLSLNAGFSCIQESLHGKCRGWEDLELGWKFLVYETDQMALTTQLLGLIPAGKKRSSLRYGRGGIQANLLFSRLLPIGKRIGRCDLWAGYRHYPSYPSDQLRTHAALVLPIAQRTHAIATGSLEYGLFNGKSHWNRNNIAFHPNYRLFQIKLECVIRSSSQSALAAGGFQNLWGRNAGCGGGFFLGAWVLF